MRAAEGKEALEKRGLLAPLLFIRIRHLPIDKKGVMPYTPAKNRNIKEEAPMMICAAPPVSFGTGGVQRCPSAGCYESAFGSSQPGKSSEKWGRGVYLPSAS